MLTVNGVMKDAKPIPTLLSVIGGSGFPRSNLILLFSFVLSVLFKIGKERTGLTVPKWYQSLSMDQRVEQLEQSMVSLSTGQQGILSRMTEMFDQLAARVEQLAIQTSRESGDNSRDSYRVNGGRNNGHGVFQHSGSTSSYAPRLVKLDFPRFNEFKEGLLSRYGPNQFCDSFDELTKLQQTGSVRDYQTHFEKLLARVGPFPQAQQVSCFVSGLRDSIKTDVQASRPSTLSDAIGLARLYEARNLSQRRATPPAPRPGFQLNTAIPTRQPSIPVRKMSPTELQERRSKGLCYNCNEKYSPGHRCKRLFVIEACWEEGDGDIIMEEDGEAEEQVEETPKISLHAISGTCAPETMRVKGSLGRVAVYVLVDSGSTHNFVSERVAQRVGLKTQLGGKFEVMVASGDKLVSPGRLDLVILHTFLSSIKIQGECLEVTTVILFFLFFWMKTSSSMRIMHQLSCNCLEIIFISIRPSAFMFLMFGRVVPAGCGVDPVNYVGNEHITAMNRPTKRGREAEDISRHQKLQISLNNNYCQDEAERSASIPNLNAVSTGLRLSYDDDERNSSITSASGSMTAAHPVILSLGNNLKTEIDRQKEEFDHYIRVQEEQIVKGVREMKQRHTASFLSAIEKGVCGKLRERELEIEDMNRKNRELVERIKQVAVEAQSWHYRAKYNESMVNVLRTNLKQAIEQGADQGKEGCGDSEIDDAASYIDQNNHFSIPTGSGKCASMNQQSKEQMTCRACNGKEVSVLLLPCRHLCLCKDCEGFIDICPVCQSIKTAGFQVYMS
ncbi:hypothetical protein HHK36_029609 [Tetracentron sinense]|uniref:RING-type domain-containing protein n=1 Tax=Tetracentron sinense TaxID=13715 RepID=A0A834YFI2_TETSI|nr:hypothetical protein HHK36_029609 [Tetracentron sinense]